MSLKAGCIALEAWFCPDMRCSDGVMSACRFPLGLVLRKADCGTGCRQQDYSCCFCVQDHLVRETALTALLAAYVVEENVSPLHAFTTRFQSRFAELVYDRDEAVAVKGIQLVTLLVKAGEMPQKQVQTCSRASSALMAHFMMQLWPVGR